MLLAQEALGHLELAELHEAEVPEGHRDVHVCHLQCEDQDQCSVRCQRYGVLQLIKIKISVQCAVDHSTKPILNMRGISSCYLGI